MAKGFFTTARAVNGRTQRFKAMRRKAYFQLRALGLTPKEAFALVKL